MSIVNLVDDDEMEILLFIVHFKIEHGGEAPTLREISHGIDKSRTAVNYRMGIMKSKGLIVAEKSKPGIQVPGEKYIPPAWFDHIEN